MLTQKIYFSMIKNGWKVYERTDWDMRGGLVRLGELKNRGACWQEVGNSIEPSILRKIGEIWDWLRSIEGKTWSVANKFHLNSIVIDRQFKKSFIFKFTKILATYQTQRNHKLNHKYQSRHPKTDKKGRRKLILNFIVVYGIILTSKTHNNE